MQNQSNPQKLTTKALAFCALLTAISVVFARLFGMMPNASSRYSIEAVPIFLAGLFFGPVAGGMVGFSADFIGCLFSAYGYNPIFCIPPVLYGVFGGLFAGFLRNRITIPRLAAAYACPVVLGSILYQSCTLSYMYFSGSFTDGLIYYLSTRSIQFAVVLVLDVLLTYLLHKTNIFTRTGLL